MLSKQRQLLYRQKDLLEDHKNELDSKKTTLEKMAKNTGQQNLKKNYDKLETSYKQLSAKLDDIEKCHNDLDSAMKDLKQKHDLITSNRTGCTEQKEKLEQELSQVTSELEHLEVSRFTDPVQLGNYIRNLEAHSQQITGLFYISKTTLKNNIFLLRWPYAQNPNTLILMKQHSNQNVTIKFC